MLLLPIKIFCGISTEVKDEELAISSVQDKKANQNLQGKTEKGFDEK